MTWPIEYPKIETLYDRDEKTFKVIQSKLRLPEFCLINEWIVTEKIDGTNVRVILNSDGTIRFGGRTGNSQMPIVLLDRLNEIFSAEKVAAAFDPGTEAILFGEGYGSKIQKGGVYSPIINFRLFDVVVKGADRLWWLQLKDVWDIAKKLEIKHVPILSKEANLGDCLSFLTFNSEVAMDENVGVPVRHEGIVCRTEPPLFTRTGQRVIWKLKVKDF